MASQNAYGMQGTDFNIKNLALEAMVAATHMATGNNSGVNSPKQTHKSSQRAGGPATNNFGILIGSTSKNSLQHQNRNQHSLTIDIQTGTTQGVNVLDDHRRAQQRSPILKYGVPGIQLRYKNISPSAKNIQTSIIKTKEYRNAFPHYFHESIEPRDRTGVL